MKVGLMKGRGLVIGKTHGKALVSMKAFTFAHGVDPSSGVITDVRSDVRGQNVRGRILFYPFGKGSTTASSWFLETVRLGNNPAAIVTEEVDLSAVIGSVMSKVVYGKEIPVMSGILRTTYAGLESGAEVSMDAGRGEVRAEG
jgi:predicted aconitase with swiveling domain